MAKSLIISLVALIAMTISPEPAMAYIDPGSGSAIMSVIVGFIVAVGMMLKTYWYKIKSIFTKKTPTEDNK